MKETFLCLNLKLDDGCLLYSMPELFNKTGHCLTDIIIALDEFKQVLHVEFFGRNSPYIYSVLRWNRMLSSKVGVC